MAATAEVVGNLKALLGTTPNGKEIYLVKRKNNPLRRLAYGSGGQLPEHLQGGYSDIKAAQNAVTEYIASLTKAVKKPKGRTTAK